MTVLVTGGMGYIGSHTCVELLEQGMDVVVVDNLVNSSAEAGRRVEQITGRPLKFYPFRAPPHLFYPFFSLFI